MPGYLTLQQSVPIEGVRDLLIRSLLDNQQFADPQGLADRAGISSSQWPLFGQLWPSGAMLAAQLALRPVTAGERILEVGCGLALASLVGHRRGADVTASDCHPLASEFLAHNVSLNGMRPLKYRTGHWVPQSVEAADGVRGTFELIVGSDLLYDRDACRLLATFIGRHAAPGGQVWVVDPDRGNRPAFNRAMGALGFAMEQLSLDRAPQGTRAGYRGRLLSYRAASLLGRPSRKTGPRLALRPGSAS
jgi:predicted nicotinamide N-methyase